MQNTWEWKRWESFPYHCFQIAVCGAVINLSSYKEHAIECKAKIAKSQHGGKSGSGKKSSSNRYVTVFPIQQNFGVFFTHDPLKKNLLII